MKKPKTIAEDRADWLLDAVACATQDRRFLRGDPAYDDVAGDAILVNAEKAISVAIARALAARTPERDDEALMEDMCFEGGRAAPNADANDVVAIVEAVIAALREAGALK